MSTTAERAVVTAAQTWCTAEEERLSALGTPAWRSRSDAAATAQRNLLIAVRRLPLGEEEFEPALPAAAPPAPPVIVVPANPDPPAAAPVLLTIAGAAVVLDISPSRVRQLVIAGSLRMHLVGALQHVERDQVVAYAVERRRVEAERVAARVA